MSKDAIWVSIIVLVIVIVVGAVIHAEIKEHRKPHHPEFDEWRGECGEHSGYWFDEQWVGKGTIDVFMKDMSEREFAQYCKGQN